RSYFHATDRTRGLAAAGVRDRSCDSAAFLDALPYAAGDPWNDIASRARDGGERNRRLCGDEGRAATGDVGVRAPMDATAGCEGQGGQSHHSRLGSWRATDAGFGGDNRGRSMRPDSRAAIWSREHSKMGAERPLV